MATVYLAHDLRHDRKVAIKVLRPELAAVIGAERFLKEIKTTANLQHPHILGLIDSGTAERLLWYAMPYVDGESLRDRLMREKQLPVADAVRIATETASALDYAHRHGVIHRDIKPENILLHDGSALVADFGIALAASTAGTRMTETGMSLGTPHYMSPEQAMGEREITARSDVYALGCITYEMLAGEPPFTGPTAQAIIARVMTEEPRSLTLQRKTIPLHVEAAVQQALQKLPADRFASAAEFASALHTPITAPSTAAARPGRRRRHLAWPAATAVAVTAAIWFALHRSSPSDQLQLARQLTFDGNVTIAAISPDGNSLAYVTDDCLGQAYTCNLTLRVRDVDGTQSVAVEKSWRAISDVKWSPNGAMLAIRGSPDSTDEAIYLTDKLGGSLRPLRVHASAMAFTHDSRLLAVATGADRQTLARYDVVSLGQVDSVAIPPSWHVADMSYSPTGDRLIAYVSATSRNDALYALLTPKGDVIDSVQATDARSYVRWAGDGAAILQFEFSPGIADDLYRIPIDARHIHPERRTIALGQAPTGYRGALDVAPTGRAVMVLAQTSQQLLLFRSAGAPPAWQSLTDRTGYFEPWSISPDGHFVAVTATDNLSDNLALLPLDSGVAARTVTASRGEHEFPEISPDGKQVAYVSWVQIPGRLVVIDANGGSERQILPGTSTNFAWLAADSIVAMRADTFIVVDTTGKEIHRMVIPGAPSAGQTTERLVKDPASQRVAYWSDVTSAVVVADLARGTARTIAHHQTPLLPVGWNHDGSVYAYDIEDPAEALSGQRHRRLVRIPPDSAKLVPVVDLPAECVTVVVDTDARHIICNVHRIKPDVWLADKAGRSRW
jgi:serine/threonine-protein kinase